MKVILSRKGFDSANGGILSPIFEDGTMLSFPIPGKDEEKDCIRYDELFCGNICLKRIMDDLKYRGAECCHLDPDLVKERRGKRIQEWIPAFGQVNQSAAYLKNQHISEGDLFFFFGNFRHVEQKNGKYKYVRRKAKMRMNISGNRYRRYGDTYRWEELLLIPRSRKKYSGIRMPVTSVCMKKRIM